MGNVCEQKEEGKGKLAARVYVLQEASPEFMLNKQNKYDTLYVWMDRLPKLDSPFSELSCDMMQSYVDHSSIQALIRPVSKWTVLYWEMGGG